MRCISWPGSGAKYQPSAELRALLSLLPSIIRNAWAGFGQGQRVSARSKLTEPPGCSTMMEFWWEPFAWEVTASTRSSKSWSVAAAGSPVLDCPRCQSPVSTVRTTLDLSCLYERSRWHLPTPATPQIMSDWGGNHAGVSRPVHPHPATETGYEKGNGEGTISAIPGS